MTKSNIKKNLLYQALYEILIVLLPLLTSPYVSRVLGAYNIGVYSYTYAVANYFVLFAALGIKNYGNREISRNRDDQKKLDETFSSILIMHLITAGLVALAYAGYLCLIVSSEYRLYAFIQSFYVIGAVLDISWLFFGVEQFKVTVTRNSAIKIFSALAVFLFVNQPEDLWKYVFILGFSNFSGQLYLWFFSKRYVKFCHVSLDKVFSHLPQMTILFIPTIAISLYNYMDKIMLGMISGNAQLGFYENTEKITFVASSVIGSVGTVMLPRMSNLVSKGEIEQGKKLIKNSMEMVLCLSCAMAFGIAGVSSNFTPLFWGENFAACAPLLAVLSIILPIKGYASVLRTQYLIPNKLDKEYTLSVVLGAALNFFVNYALIPSMQAMGAVIGTVVAELAVCLVQLHFCAKELPVFVYLRTGVIYMAFGIVMMGFTRFIEMWLGKGISVLILQIFGGALIYTLLCLTYFVTTKNQLFFDTMQGIQSKFINRSK